MNKVLDNLTEAEALLQCLALALEYGEGNLAKAPDYGLVVKLASGLLRESINTLAD